MSGTNVQQDQDASSQPRIAAIANLVRLLDRMSVDDPQRRTPEAAKTWVLERLREQGVPEAE